MRVLEVLSWKPLCVSMPAEELTLECWHPRLEVADEKHGVIRCPSCGKKWFAMESRKTRKEEKIVATRDSLNPQ